MTIRLLVAGGTIDKQYDENTGNLIFSRTHIPALLAQGRCRVPLTVQSVFLKDSLEMTDADRALLCQHATQSVETRLIITHGTDTMVETARCLANCQLSKTIVLLGSMIPYRFKHSDSLFNLGCAIAAVQCLPTGVFITMNGQVFPWDKVVKNRQQGIFEWTA
ncbi:L-asparaginase/GlutRNAGln amidotransferase subunit D [Beggiatoa alba B18LD]|uniref:L-asparaginase/GlutRNAGln amidotransferase subunit D n=1 Tax=Beggiatoa alba B18LD TaxID=395493 RepID=I3CBV3_9GAMM|nr:asparaginase domain-containing protein [Beggiatoa alba]EIJ41096.1 L-asparaginase/GlutRNAGln amidotransferase subunit D [Beggiatoa alba B18LD]